MRLEKTITKLEAAKLKQIGESSEVQPNLNTRWGMLPYSFQGQLPQVAQEKNKAKEELQEEFKDLKEKRIEERNRYEVAKETIVQTTIMIIFEKLNAKLYALHEVCKILYLAVNNIQSDSRVVKPTYQKWISRIDKLKTIELCARVDPNALVNAMPIAKLVRSLRDFTILPKHIEARWLELKGDFENHKDIVVPPLLKNY